MKLIPDEYSVSLALRGGWPRPHMPVYPRCADCGRELDALSCAPRADDFELCCSCETWAVDRFEAFLGSFSAAQLNTLDRLCEGASLMDIAGGI